MRHFVAFTFALNTFINSMLQLSFASVQEQSSIQYNVSQSDINIFSLLYPIFYLPGTFLSVYMFERFELRKSFLFASFLQTFGSLLRWISVLYNFNNTIVNHNYIIGLIGTMMPALCQPFYSNSPARIAAEWYSVDGRDAVTSILSVIAIVGGGFGMFVPILFINANVDTNDTDSDTNNL